MLENDSIDVDLFLLSMPFAGSRFEDSGRIGFFIQLDQLNIEATKQ